jgi:phage terminase Nu1 subunit (DNA packaging protein)
LKKKAKAAVPEEPASLIVATRAEAASELKRRIGKGSVRTLADWFTLGCPNTPGAYDVDAIERWVTENIGTENDFEATMESQEDRAYWSLVKIREQALKSRAERLLLEGRLVDTDEINRLVERLAGTLLSMLGQWPDWILSLLPTSVTADARRAIRKKVGTKVDELGHSVADLLGEWSQAKEGSDGDSEIP